jgi:hypothetical protein
MTKKTIYLHIGMPKAGSTAIRGFCCNNKELLNQNDYDYPFLSNIQESELDKRLVTGNGTYLLDEIRKKAKISDILKEYVDKSQHNNIIISYEVIGNTNIFYDNILEHGLDDLVKQNIDLKIIAYIRNPIESLYSLWKQGVRYRGEVISMSVYQYIDVKKIKEKAVLEQILKLDEVIDKNIFIIRPYHRSLLVQNSSLSDFFHTIGLDYNHPTIQDKIKNYQNVNSGISRSMCEIARIANQFIEGHSVFNDKFIQPNLHLDSDSNCVELDLEFINSIKEEFLPLEKQLAQKYLGRDFLFPHNLNFNHREFHQIDANIFNKFVEFLENDPLINQHRNTKSDKPQNANVSNKKDPSNKNIEKEKIDKQDLATKNSQVIELKNIQTQPKFLKRKALKLICCFVPNKEFRKKIRGKK